MYSPLSSEHDSPSTRTLRAYGWDEFFENSFTDHAAAGLVPARIARVDRGQVTAITGDGPVRAACGTHTHEPGCAVLAAIADGLLPERRLASYRELQRENAWAAARSDARLRAEREDQRRSISRNLRATYGFRGRQR